MLIWWAASAMLFIGAESWSWRWFFHVAHGDLRWYQHVWWWPLVSMLNACGVLIFMSGFLPKGRPLFYKATYTAELDAMMHEADPNDDAYWERRRKALAVNGVHDSDPIYKRHL
jgi:hypothetical protein